MKKCCFLFLLVVLITLEQTALALESFIIKRIKVNGVHETLKHAVLHELRLQIGKRFYEKDAAEVIRVLFKKGFFSDVKVERDKNTLIIHIKERRTIEFFELMGLKDHDKVIEILKKYNICQGRVFDPSALRCAEHEIRHFFLSTNQFGLKLKTSVMLRKRNLVAVRIFIYDSGIKRVRSIHIVGNNSFSGNVLRKQLLHKVDNWFSWLVSDDHYSNSKHIKELEHLKGFYMERGFVNFQVNSSQISLSPDKSSVYIKINVSEGDIYKFGRIELSGKCVIPRDEMLKLINNKIHTGMVFSKSIIMSVKNDLEKRLGVDGYTKGRVSVSIEKDMFSKIINVKLNVKPKVPITIKRINFTGNYLTQDNVLRSGFEQMEGSLISPQDMDMGRSHMLREGYASNVEIEYRSVRYMKDQVIAIVRMTEQKLSQFSAGFSYSLWKSLNVNFAADLRNFLGSGTRISFGIDKNRTLSSYNIGYFDPFFFPNGMGVGYNVYYQKSSLTSIPEVFEFGTDAIGGDITLSMTITPYDKLLTSLGIDKTRLVNINVDDISTPNEIKKFVQTEGIKFNEMNASISLIHNSFNTFILPTNGFYQNFSVKASLPISTLKYFRFEYDFDWFHQLNEEYIFNISGNFGFQTNYINKQCFPFYKNFHVGGTNAIRGYLDRSLGPRDSKGNSFGGNVLVITKASFIFPSPFDKYVKNVRTSLFLDAGQVYDTINKNSYNAAYELKNSHFSQWFRYSVGASIMWHTPMEIPVIFSFAKPINSKLFDKTERFIFSFGM